MIKRRVLPGIVIVILLAAVVWLFAFTRPTRSTEQPPEERIADVKVMQIRPVSLKDWIELPASVDPFVSTEVPAEIGGRIDWIGPEEGDRINKPGTPILRIDQRTFKAQVDEAQANYNLSYDSCKRMEQLYDQGIASKEQLDKCKATLATDAAKLEIAKIQLEKATVRSPIAGILNKSYFEVGEYVRQGDRVADIVVIDPVKVVVKVPEKDIPYVHRGEKVEIAFNILGGKKYKGTVSYISIIGDEATRTYELEITVPNPSHEILPSMIARVNVLRHEIPDAITVPLFAVIPRGDFKTVFIENDGKAEERQVELGILEGSRVQIISGIKPDERLIVEGHRELSDGEAVRVQGPVEELL